MKIIEDIINNKLIHFLNYYIYYKMKKLNCIIYFQPYKLITLPLYEAVPNYILFINN